MKHITQNQFSKAKLVALFVFIFSVAGAFAGPDHNQGSSFRLLLPSTGEHTVVIDNVPYTGVFNNFKLDNLRQGNHRIKIVQVVFSRRGRAQIVNRFVLYNGMVFIPKNAKVWASVSNDGCFIIERTYHRDNRRGNDGRNRGYDNRDYDNNRNYDQRRDNRDRRRDDYYDDDWYGYSDQNSGNRNDNYGRNDDQQYSNNRNNDQQYSRNNNQRSDETFALTLNAIKKQSFDSDRLKIAKNAVVQGNMLSSEVAEITKLFSFESSRLEFAKYAYLYTIDRKNYVIVQDAFQFSSSTSELQDYITQMGNH